MIAQRKNKHNKFWGVPFVARARVVWGKGDYKN